SSRAQRAHSRQTRSSTARSWTATSRAGSTSVRCKRVSELRGGPWQPSPSSGQRFWWSLTCYGLQDIELAQAWLTPPNVEGVVAKRADRPYVAGRGRGRRAPLRRDQRQEVATSPPQPDT